MKTAQWNVTPLPFKREKKIFKKKNKGMRKMTGAIITFAKNRRINKTFNLFLSLLPLLLLLLFLNPEETKKRKNSLYLFLVVTHNNTSLLLLREERAECWEKCSFTPFSYSVSQVWSFFFFLLHNGRGMKSCSSLLAAVVSFFTAEELTSWGLLCRFW